MGHVEKSPKIGNHFRRSATEKADSIAGTRELGLTDTTTYMSERAETFYDVSVNIERHSPAIYGL